MRAPEFSNRATSAITICAVLVIAVALLGIFIMMIVGMATGSRCWTPDPDPIADTGSCVEVCPPGTPGPAGPGGICTAPCANGAQGPVGPPGQTGVCNCASLFNSGITVTGGPSSLCGGTVTICQALVVQGVLSPVGGVAGPVSLSGAFSQTGGTFQVAGASIFGNTVSFTGTTLTATGNVNLCGGALTVCSAAQFQDDVTILGDLSVSGALTFQSLVLSGTFYVGGTSVFDGMATFNGGITIGGVTNFPNGIVASSLSTFDDMVVNGVLTVAGSMLIPGVLDVATIQNGLAGGTPVTINDNAVVTQALAVPTIQSLDAVSPINFDQGILFSSVNGPQCIAQDGGDPVTICGDMFVTGATSFDGTIEGASGPLVVNGDLTITSVFTALDLAATNSVASPLFTSPGATVNIDKSLVIGGAGGLSAATGVFSGSLTVGGTFSVGSLAVTSLTAVTSVTAPVLSATVELTTPQITTVGSLIQILKSVTMSAGTTLTADLLVATSCTGCTSDERLKRDIEPLDRQRSLTAVMALEPVSYRFRPEFDGTYSLGELRGRRRTGFIAQRVHEVMPEAVTRRNGSLVLGDTQETIDGLLSVHKDEMVAHLVAALQAQELRLRELEAVLGAVMRR